MILHATDVHDWRTHPVGCMCDGCRNFDLDDDDDANERTGRHIAIHHRPTWCDFDEAGE